MTTAEALNTTLGLARQEEYFVKRAADMPNLSMVLPGALAGAVALGGLQGVRKLFATPAEREEGRSPSILKGILLGGLLGGGAGFAAPSLLDWMLSGAGAPPSDAAGQLQRVNTGLPYGRETLHTQPSGGLTPIPGTHGPANTPFRLFGGLPNIEARLPPSVSAAQLQQVATGLPPTRATLSGLSPATSTAFARPFPPGGQLGSP